MRAADVLMTCRRAKSSHAYLSVTRKRLTSVCAYVCVCVCLCVLCALQSSPVLQGLSDRDPYVRRTAVMGVLKIYHVDTHVVENTGTDRGHIDAHTHTHTHTHM